MPRSTTPSASPTPDGKPSSSWKRRPVAKIPRSTSRQLAPRRGHCYCCWRTEACLARSPSAGAAARRWPTLSNITTIQEASASSCPTVSSNTGTPSPPAWPATPCSPCSCSPPGMTLIPLRRLRCDDPLGEEPRNPVRFHCPLTWFRGSSLTLLAPQPARGSPGGVVRSSLTTTALDTGVLEPRATEPRGTSGLVSG